MTFRSQPNPNHPKLGWKGEGHSWSPTDAESYYSLFCDYGMTDPATGEWAPHKPIGKVNKNGESVFELPKDAVEIAKTALDRYTEVRQSEDPKVDEAINRFEAKLKEQGRLMFSFAKTPEEFDAVQREAVRQKGIVVPGLNTIEFEVVKVPRHDFTGTGKDAIRKAKVWAMHNIQREHTYHEGKDDSFKYEIDEDAIGKFLSSSSTTDSDNLGVHLAVLKKLPEVIDKSIEVEIHPDYKKIDKKRRAENGVDSDKMLVHRMYGAVMIDGKVYRAKTTMHEFRDDTNKPHDYKITEVKLIISGSSTSNALNSSTSVDGANLLENVEKSYDTGVKLLTASEKTPTMFSSAPGSLVAMHNLTASNLDHVVKMGGIANPSMAVVDSDISVLDNFGEITLIAPRELIEKKTGKNAGTWAADAYSPRYPNVEYVIPYKKQRELEQRAVDAGVGKYEATTFVQRIEDSGKKWLDGDKTALALFAKEGREGESFDDYIDRLMNEVVQKEQIFMGYTDNGRRYAKHTLSNVSRIMKKEGRAGNVA